MCFQFLLGKASIESTLRTNWESSRDFRRYNLFPHQRKTWLTSLWINYSSKITQMHYNLNNDFNRKIIVKYSHKSKNTWFKDFFNLLNRFIKHDPLFFSQMQNQYFNYFNLEILFNDYNNLKVK
jgi:hypothetical protein